MRHFDHLTRADERLTAVKLTREPREASIRTGRALLSTAMAAIEVAGLGEFVARVEDLPPREVWLTLAGYHILEMRDGVGEETYQRAAALMHSAQAKAFRDLAEGVVERLDSLSALKLPTIG